MLASDEASYISGATIAVTGGKPAKRRPGAKPQDLAML